MTRRDPGLLQLKHGALLVFTLIFAVRAAPVYENEQTAIESYDGVENGCYYNYNHYGEGDRIVTNEPCLNCTCHNRMLMCYLRVCPFTKPIGQDCIVEKREDQCCPVITCPEAVPVELIDNGSTTVSSTDLALPDNYGCSINGRFYAEGAQVPSNSNKPCELCYCIRNMTACVMQECTLHIDGCQPIYNKGVCCPVRYSCDHESEMPLLDDHSTTTVRPTEGFILTTPKTDTQECIYSNITYTDGSLITTEDPCKHCYCMKGDIVCAVPECGEPLEHEDCVAVPAKTGQCCPDTYICNGSETVTIPPESQLDEQQQHIVPQKSPVKGGVDTKRKGPVPEKPKDTKVDKSSEEDLGEDQFITTSTEKATSDEDDMSTEHIPQTTVQSVDDSEKESTEPAIDDDKTTRKPLVGKPENVDDRFSEDETTFKTITEHAEIDEPATTTFRSDKPSDQGVSKPKEQTTETEEQTTVGDSQPSTVKPLSMEIDEEESSGSESTTPIQTKEDQPSKTEEPLSTETTTMTYSEEQGMSKGDGVSGSAESGESTEDKIPTTESPSHKEKETESPQIIDALTEITPNEPITEHSLSEGETPSVHLVDTDTDDMVKELTTLAPSVADEEKKAKPHVETPAVKTDVDIDETTVNSAHPDDAAQQTTLVPDSDEDVAETTFRIPTRGADVGDDDLTSEEESASKSTTSIPAEVAEATTVPEIDSPEKEESEEHTEKSSTDKVESATSQETEGITTIQSIVKSPVEEVTETVDDTNETTVKTQEKEISDVTEIPSQTTASNEGSTESEKSATEVSPESSTKTSELDYAELPVKDIVTELPSEEEDVPEPVTLSQKPMESDSHTVDDTTTRPDLEVSTDLVVPSDESDEMNTIIPDKTTNQPEKSYVEKTTLQPDEKSGSDDHSTDIPTQVPGEGDCLFNGISYLNNAPIPTDEECLESCVCFNSIVRCKSTCDLESGVTESPSTDEEDTTAVVVEVTKPSVEFPAVVKEIYPTEAPIIDDDNTEENEIDSGHETTIRPLVKAPLTPESNEVDIDAQTTESPHDESEFTTVPNVVHFTEKVETAEKMEDFTTRVPATDNKVNDKTTDLPEAHGTDKPDESVPDLSEVTEKPEEHLTEKSEEQVTEKSEEQITETPEEQLTEKSEEHATEKSEHQITEKPEEHLTKKSEDHVTEKSEEQITETPEEHLTEKSEEPSTEKSEEHVTETPEEHLTQKPEEHETKKSEEHGTEKSEEQVTEQPEEHSTEKSEEHATEKSSELSTEKPEHKVQGITEQSVKTVSDEDYEVESTTSSVEDSDEDTTINTVKEPGHTTVLPEESETQATEKPAISNEDKMVDIDEALIHPTTVVQEKIDIFEDNLTEATPAVTEKQDHQITESPDVEEISTEKQLDETSTYKISTKPKDHVSETTEVDQTLATEAPIEPTQKTSETTILPDLETMPHVEETTYRKPGSLDDRIGSGEDEQEVPETTTMRTQDSTENALNQETTVPVLVKETSIKPLVHEYSTIKDIDYDVTTMSPEKDVVLDQKSETIAPTVEKEIDSTTDISATSPPEQTNVDEENDESQTTLSPSISKEPVTTRTQLRPDDEETKVPPQSESSETVDEITEKAEPTTTESNEQKTEISTHDETTVKSAQESVEDLAEKDKPTLGKDTNVTETTEKQDENVTDKTSTEDLEQKTEASSQLEKDTTTSTAELSTEKIESEHSTSVPHISEGSATTISPTESDISSEDDIDKKQLETPSSTDSKHEQEEKDEETTEAGASDETTKVPQNVEDSSVDTSTTSIEDHTTKPVEDVTSKRVDSSDEVETTTKKDLTTEQNLEQETDIAIEKTTVSIDTSVATEAIEDIVKESQTVEPEAQTTEIINKDDENKEMQTDRPEHQTDIPEHQTDIPEHQTTLPVKTVEDEKKPTHPETHTTVPVRSQFDSSEDQDTTTDSKIKDADVSEPNQTEKSVEDDQSHTDEETSTSRAEKPTTKPELGETEGDKVQPHDSIDEKVEKTETTFKPITEEETTVTATEATTNQVIEADVQVTKKPTVDDIQKPIDHDHSIPEHPLEEPYTTNPPVKSPDSGLPQAGYPSYGDDYTDEEEEDPTQFGPGTCRYGGKLYVSAQQIPRDDPCDFCFCFRSDIICLQQSCPPPIQNCHEEPISGFCCPRYECHVGMATHMNITTSTTTTTTTLPPHFVNSYKGAARKSGCLIQGKAYAAGDEVFDSSTPCMKCECGGDAQMKCEPRKCGAGPMLQQMIAAAQRKKR